MGPERDRQAAEQQLRDGRVEQQACEGHPVHHLTDGLVAVHVPVAFFISPDRLKYSFTLLDGLKFHEGSPVTTKDVIASLKRWGAKDSMGQKLMGFVKDMPVVNAKTFKIVLNEPTGLVLGALGVFGALQDALNTIWEVQPKPGLSIVEQIKLRFMPLTLVLGTGFLLMVSLVVSASLAAAGATLRQHADLAREARTLAFSLAEGQR